MNPHPLVTVWTEERAESSFVVLRTYAGGQVHYGPFAEDGVEAAIMHLGSALATTAMCYQTVLRGGAFGGRLHEQGLPEETPDKRREIAEQCRRTTRILPASSVLDLIGMMPCPAWERS